MTKCVEFFAQKRLTVQLGWKLLPQLTVWACPPPAPCSPGTLKRQNSRLSIWICCDRSNKPLKHEAIAASRSLFCCHLWVRKPRNHYVVESGVINRFWRMLCC